MKFIDSFSFVPTSLFSLNFNFSENFIKNVVIVSVFLKTKKLKIIFDI